MMKNDTTYDHIDASPKEYRENGKNDKTARKQNKTKKGKCEKMSKGKKCGGVIVTDANVD